MRWKNLWMLLLLPLMGCGASLSHPTQSAEQFRKHLAELDKSEPHLKKGAGKN